MLKKELEKQLHEFVIQVYKEGFEEGREDAEMDTKARVKGAYEKGLEDSWDFFKKIYSMDVEEIDNIYGSGKDPIDDYTPLEALQKLKEYEEQHKQDEKCENCAKEISAKCVVDGCEFEPKQTDANDMDVGSIKVGDEVVMFDYPYIVVRIRDDGTFEGIHAYGCDIGLTLSNFHKTGRYFPQIAEVLKLLRGEEK